MKQTTKQLKAVRDNAPESATHSDNERDYFKRTDNTQRSATQWEMWSGHNWYSTHETPDFALADIAEIIELREKLAQAQKQLASAKVDGIREAIIECGLRKHYTGFTYIDEEALLEHLYELDKAT